MTIQWAVRASRLYKLNNAAGKNLVLHHSKYLTTYKTPENTTLSRQHELKKFGVPKLEDTFSKYLKSLVPFLNQDEMSRTKDLINKFSNGIGQKLQDLLQKRAENEDNWLADWWIDRAYLAYRGPVVVWSSPGAIFPKQKFQTVDEQLDFAARLVSGMLDFKSILDRQCFPVECMGQDPMDMQQIYKQFGGCRIPGPNKDDHVLTSNSKHITVIHNNEFFKLKVINHEGLPLCPEEIFGALKYIVEKSPTRNSNPVGILTSMDRDDWFNSYQLLLQDNESVLRDIQASLFVLCLDGESEGFFSTECPQSTAVAQAIHGLGSKFHSGNRWFDTTLQVFVGRSGENGMTIEHTPAEALSPMTIADHALHCANGGLRFQNESCKRIEELPKHLTFQLPDEVRLQIQKTSQKLDELVHDLETAMLHVKTFGKSFIKNQRFSPDSFLQMAMQYAFFRIHRVPGAHYESGGLRLFKYGRTDVIRSCSKESIEFAQTMLNNNSSLEDKMKAMSAAIVSHNDFARQVCRGAGVDRHLLGLKLIANEYSIEDRAIDEFYGDPGWVRSTTHRISTSQVSAKQETCVAYGPLVMDGYACCYNIRNNDLLFGLSAMRSCPDTSVITFKEALEQSLFEMHDLAASCRNMSKL